jgi:hypothetical protein
MKPKAMPRNSRKAHERAAGHERELHLHANQRAEQRSAPWSGEQHVGVAQHAVLLKSQPGRALTGNIEVRVHGCAISFP